MIGVWGKQLSSSVRSRQSGADAVQAQPVLSHNAAVPLGRFRIRSIWPYLRPATLAPYIVSLPIAGLVAGLLLPSLSREVMATLPIWSATLVGAACLGLAVQRISRKEVGLVATLVVASAIVAPSFSYPKSGSW